MKCYQDNFPATSCQEKKRDTEVSLVGSDLKRAVIMNVPLSYQLFLPSTTLQILSEL